MTKKVFLASAAMIVIGLLVLLWVFGLQEYFSLGYIQSSGDSLRSWIDAHPLRGTLGYFSLYVVIILLCLPAAAIMTLTAGFLFGLWMGIFLVLISSITGTTLLFLLAQTSFGNILRNLTAGFYTKYAGPLHRDAFHYMIFMRLIPGVPSPVATILPALFHIPLKQFFPATLIGIIPGTLIFVYLGQALGEARTISDLVTPPVLLTLAVLALTSISPIILRKIKGQGSSQ